MQIKTIHYDKSIHYIGSGCAVNPNHRVNYKTLRYVENDSCVLCWKENRITKPDRIFAVAEKIKITLKRKKNNVSCSINYFEKWCRRIEVRCLEKGIPFNLTVDWLKENYQDTCPVLGIHMLVKYGNGDHKPHVDKVIPSLGYLQTNCRIISGRANRIKSDASTWELIQIAGYMLNHQYKKLY